MTVLGDSDRVTRRLRASRANHAGSSRIAALGAIVHVVDDESSMRMALQRALLLAGFRVALYDSGPDFIETLRPNRLGCLLLDVRMPGMDGLEVQARLRQLDPDLPIIFVTGSADVPTAVTAMREGAVDFIEKPFENELLISRVQRAIEHYRRTQSDAQDQRVVLDRLSHLAPRQIEVLGHIVEGYTNRQIAKKLGVSPRTVETHRTHIMEKMQASTLADLVRMSLLSGTALEQNSHIV